MRLLAFILAVALAIVGTLVVMRRQTQAPFEMVAVQPGTPSPLTKLWPVQDFTLTERSGQPVTLASLKGKVWVADFFYTTCPGPCPMLSSRLSEIQKAVGSDPDVRLVSISSDPEKDTPEILRQYAERFQAGEHWLFLTGPKAEVYTLANQGFKLGLSEDPKGAEPVIHSLKLVLVDRAGNVRGFYDGVGGDVKRIVSDIQRLKSLGE